MLSHLTPQNPHLIHDCLAKLPSSEKRRSGASLFYSSGERGENKRTAPLGFVSIRHNEKETCQTAERLQHDDVRPRLRYITAVLRTTVDGAARTDCQSATADLARLITVLTHLHLSHRSDFESGDSKNFIAISIVKQ
ncbi:hypothetical protein LguiA_009387 [Lonicera macranthoides]